MIDKAAADGMYELFRRDEMRVYVDAIASGAADAANSFLKFALEFPEQTKIQIINFCTDRMPPGLPIGIVLAEDPRAFSCKCFMDEFMEKAKTWES